MPPSSKATPPVTPWAQGWGPGRASALPPHMRGRQWHPQGTTKQAAMSPGPFPVPTPVLCDLGRSPVTASDLAAQVFPRFASSLRVGPLSLSSFWGLSGWTGVWGYRGLRGREKGFGMGPGRSSPGRPCGRAQRPLPVPWGPPLSELRVCPRPPDTVSHTAMLARPGCTVPVPTRPPRNLLPHGQDTRPLQGL